MVMWPSPVTRRGSTPFFVAGSVKVRIAGSIQRSHRSAKPRAASMLVMGIRHTRAALSHFAPVMRLVAVTWAAL